MGGENTQPAHLLGGAVSPHCRGEEAREGSPQEEGVSECFVGLYDTFRVSPVRSSPLAVTVCDILRNLARISLLQGQSYPPSSSLWERGNSIRRSRKGKQPEALARTCVTEAGLWRGMRT